MNSRWRGHRSELQLQLLRLLLSDDDDDSYDVSLSCYSVELARMENEYRICCRKLADFQQTNCAWEKYFGHQPIHTHTAIICGQQGKYAAPRRTIQTTVHYIRESESLTHSPFHAIHCRVWIFIAHWRVVVLCCVLCADGCHRLLLDYFPSERAHLHCSHGHSPQFALILHLVTGGEFIRPDRSVP